MNKKEDQTSVSNIPGIETLNGGTCGTEEESLRLSQVLVNFVGNGNLSVCK